MILWGPPGCGKTTLARIIAKASGKKIYELSAVSTGKKELQEIIAQNSQPTNGLPFQPDPPVVFLDEIHRFNKSQQDFLLPFVERGEIYLIGATTENPSFEVISALLSRCRIFVLNALSGAELEKIIVRAIAHLEKHFQKKYQLDQETVTWLIEYCGGDARRLLTLLDTTANLYPKINVKTLSAVAQSRHLNYDKSGEEHYNTISAFIKSMRASNVDASLYYLGRMVSAGEDPLFIARRMVIFASEDIGMADPQAVSLAVSIFQACHLIGYPECAINLSHGVAYLAQAPKNRQVYDSLQLVMKDVERLGHLPIPMELRNAPTKLMRDVGYGQGYEMYPQDKSLLPEKIKNKQYWPKPKLPKSHPSTSK